VQTLDVPIVTVSQTQVGAGAIAAQTTLVGGREIIVSPSPVNSEDDELTSLRVPRTSSSPRRLMECS
jgi:hypothetical protein